MHLLWKKQAKNPSEEINYRAAANHAKNRTDFYISPVHKQQDKYDYKGNGHVGAAMRDGQSNHQQYRSNNPLFYTSLLHMVPFFCKPQNCL